MGRGLKWLAIALLVVLALGAGSFAGWRAVTANMVRPGANEQAVRIEVPPGLALRGILAGLRREGALRHPRLVELYLRLHGRRPRAQAGRYEIAPHATPRQIVEQLEQGRVMLASLTVVEGWSFAQMRSALDADADVAHPLRGLSAPPLLSALGHPGEAAGGRFFPDT